MDKYLVYVHTCDTNGKKYVGLTKQSISKRTGCDGSGYKRNRVFWNAIEKHGWNSFVTTIVADNLTREEAAILEMKLIKELKTQDRNFGYNIDEGGFAPVNSEETKKRKSIAKMGHPVSEETKEKLKQRNKGQIVSEEARRKMSLARKGKPRSKECCMKMSASMKGRKKPENGGSPPKPVRCVETGIEYPSLAEAARQTKSCMSKIGAVCNGHRKTTNGLHWEYINLN